jgi:CheY-like chemotaxis protein
MKIFVVDDDAILLGFMRRWLASLEGHEVHVFERGASAIEALTTETPCLLVCDLEMPGMSGEEVAEAAARLPRPPRIVLMSGDRARLQRARALAEATLNKPFSFKDLLAVIEAGVCVPGA